MDESQTTRSSRKVSVRTLQNALRPFRRHLQHQRLMGAAATSMQACGVGVVVWSLVTTWLGGFSLEARLYPVAGLILAGLGAAAIVQGLRRCTWLDVARRIDRDMRLQDRLTTAWHLTSAHINTPIATSQVSEALEQLARSAPRALAPLEWRRRAQLGIGMCLAGLLIMVVSQSDSAAIDPQRDGRAVSPQIADQVARHVERQLLDELQAMIKHHRLSIPQEAELPQLANELQQQVEALRKQPMSARDLVAKLSTMQAKVESTRTQLQAHDRAATWDQLAATMAHDESLAQLSDVLAQHDYREAARQVPHLDPAQLSPVALEQVRHDLQQMAERARAEHDDQTAEALEGLHAAFQESSADERQNHLKPLQSLLEQQAAQQELQQLLASQMEGLAEAKGMSQDGGKNIARSDESRETWGRGRAGDPLEQASSARLAASRERLDLEGVRGAGPSRREHTTADHAEPQSPRRSYQDRFPAYAAAAEDAVRQEDLPWGQRQMIRDYFRAIRPQASNP